MTGSLDGREFRRVLGHYPTGVCAVTAAGSSGPVGMIVGSFSSVSLDPPLVSFLPDRRSMTWRKIEAQGRFCVNVLAQDQRDVCVALSARGENKFETIGYRLSNSGVPIIDGVVAWIDCCLYAVHEAGDHFIVLGLVQALEVEQASAPLIFVRGGYGGVTLHAVGADAKASAA